MRTGAARRRCWMIRPFARGSMVRRRRLLPRAFAVALLLLTAAAPPGPAPAPSASPEDIQRLIGTLNDPAARERLLGELNALLAAKPDQPAPPTWCCR